MCGLRVFAKTLQSTSLCSQSWMCTTNSNIHSCQLQRLKMRWCCKLQIQEELESLAEQATANAMNIIKCEKHVFTNNNSYMQLLNKMKAFVLCKQQFLKTMSMHPFRPTKEEVSECCFSL